MMHKKRWPTLVHLILLTCMGLPVSAGVTADEAARLGADLTPVGATKAGNAAGTIPAWQGGITQPPANYKPGMHHPDPFSEDRPLFVITAENLHEHEANLSPGQIALFKRYPDTFRMPVYASRRTASLPEQIYERTIANATTATLTKHGNGVLNAAEGIPFPIPKNGLEAVWNHLLRYRGTTMSTSSGQASPTADGSYVVVRLKEDILWAYHQPGANIETIDNKLAYFRQEVLSPPRLAGQILVVHETLNQAAEPRKAWTYNPGQRRVRRAPNVGYDNPGTASDGQRTNDQSDVFNGAPDRYDWTLVGKRELYVPYNSYRLHSDQNSFDDILQPGHINPKLTRYELHRVWVVEARLKEGLRNIYARRTFYLDEDSWQISIADQYDGRGEIWRVSEAHVINYYDVPLTWTTLLAVYDVQNGRYLAMGLSNEFKPARFDHPLDRNQFTTEALRQLGRR